MIKNDAHISDELRAAIAVAKERVEVAPYYQLALNRGLKGHASGFWSGTLMGLVTGAGIGTLLSVALPATLIGALAGLPIIAIVASVGATAGGLTGSRIGITAVTVAGVMQEKERRDKAEALEKEIVSSPEKQREVLAAYRDNPRVEKDDNVEEILSTSKGGWDALFKIFRLKSYAVAVPVCVVMGAMMAAGIAAPLVATGGSMVFLGALTVTSVAEAALVGGLLGAGMGVAFGTYYPPIFATLQRVSAESLSGKMFDRMFGKAPEMMLSPTKSSASAPKKAPNVTAFRESEAATWSGAQEPNPSASHVRSTSHEGLLMEHPELIRLH